LQDSQRHFSIRNADHTGFTVSSLEESLAFWVGALGFRLLVRDRFAHSSFLDNIVGVAGADLTLAMLEAPGGHLIELLEYHAPADRRTVKPRSCDVGSVHLAFMVDDLDAVLARVGQAGWPRLGAPQTVQDGTRAGLRIVYARGPDGVTIEFLQPPRQSDGTAAAWKTSLGA